MAVIFTVANQKGGVGKTTTVFNLAACMADAGAKVLAIDLDPQGSLTVCYGINPNELGLSMYHVLCKGEPIRNILLQMNENLYLAPAVIDLAAVEIEISSKFSREHILAKAIGKVCDEFDFILIDAQPSLSLLPINALCAADYVVVPVTPEYLSYKGLQLLQGTIEQVTESINKQLSILGVIVSMYDKRTRHANEVMELLKRDWTILGVIDRAIAVQDAVLANQPITTFDSDSKAANEYRNIAATLMKLNEKRN